MSEAEVEGGGGKAEPEAEAGFEFDKDCPKIDPTIERVKSTAKRNLPVIPRIILSSVFVW